MKKLIAAIMTALLILCPVSAYAALTHISYVPGSAKMEVYGNYQKIKDYYEITLGVPGLDTVQLPGGVTLSGSNENEADTNMRIIIVPVTVSDEPAAHKWLTGNLPKAGKNSSPYYLGFYDDNDKHYSLLDIEKAKENTVIIDRLTTTVYLKIEVRISLLKLSCEGINLLFCHIFTVIYTDKLGIIIDKL